MVCLLNLAGLHGAPRRIGIEVHATMRETRKNAHYIRHDRIEYCLSTANAFE